MKKLSALFLLAMFIFSAVACCKSGELSTEELAQRNIEQTNMEIIRQTHASLAAGDIEAFKAVIGPNYVRHCQAMPPGMQELHGTDVFFGFLEEWVAGVPGYTDTISNMVADGDMVAYVSTMEGVQTGALGELQATGKSFTLVNIVMQRLEDGKVVETWVSWDNVAFLTQLGLMPGQVGEGEGLN